MNIEWEVKNILRMKIDPEKRAEFICDFTTFNKEDIIKAIKQGGKTPSDLYGNLIKLWEKRQLEELVKENEKRKN